VLQTLNLKDHMCNLTNKILIEIHMFFNPKILTFLTRKFMDIKVGGKQARGGPYLFGGINCLEINRTNSNNTYLIIDEKMPI